MKDWRSRLCVAAVILLAMQAHADLAAHLPNTPGGMLAMYGSAAFIDFVLLSCAPWLLHGRLCDDMETLCFASIVANFAGWIAYMAYAPPHFYNFFMSVLSLVQFIRLLLVDGDAPTDIGRGMVRRPAPGGA